MGCNSTDSCRTSLCNVQNVAEQNRLDLASLSQRRKAVDTANQTTLNILKNLLNVDSNIVDIDKTVQRARKTARLSSAKNVINIPKVANTASDAALSKIKVGRPEHIITTDQKEKKKRTTLETRNINKRRKSVGTELASSLSFKQKFSVLLQQNISNETLNIEYEIPTKFDGRKVWKDYIKDVRSQGICGSCWAFSTVFVLESRLSIYSKGKYNYVLSPSKMILCSLSLNNDKNLLDKIKTNLENGVFLDFKTSEKKSNILYGCSGENLINAWQYLYRFGVPENDCFQYGDERDFTLDLDFDLTSTDEVSSSSCGDLSSFFYDICPTTKKSMVSHRAGGFYLVPGTISEDKTKPQGSEYNIRKEIYKWGPCTSGMIVYQDFIDWNGLGIYKYDGISQRIGGHAIVLMGWGEYNNKKYWIVRNSWGNDWGDKGYFKILRGSNHCEIEENVVVGFPNIPAIRLFLDYPLLYQKEDLIINNLWKMYDNGIKETTLEKLSMGIIKKDDSELFNKYSVKEFPNFYKYIAGKIIKENFHYKKRCGKNIKILIITSLIFLILFLFIKYKNEKSKLE